MDGWILQNEKVGIFLKIDWKKKFFERTEEKEEEEEIPYYVHSYSLGTHHHAHAIEGDHASSSASSVRACLFIEHFRRRCRRRRKK